MPRTAWPRFLRRWAAWVTRAGAGYRPRFRPAVLPLEDRLAPAAHPWAAGMGGAGTGVLFAPAGDARGLTAYEPAFAGGARLAVGDVTGDGTPDLVTGAGAGGGPRVVVVDGATGAVARTFFAFEESFRGGAYVAVGDVDGDGRADVIAGAGEGGGPRVRAFSGADGRVLLDFFAFDPAGRGGVRVAAGDVDGDGAADVVAGAGPGGPPEVRVFAGRTGAELARLAAYEPGFAGGVHVAAGDVDGDGRADVVTGAGDGGGPRVRAFAPGGAVLADFLAYAADFRGGVRVAAGGAAGGPAALWTAAGPGGGPHVRGWEAGTLRAVEDLMAFDPTARSGAYVAAGFVPAAGADIRAADDAAATPFETAVVVPVLANDTPAGSPLRLLAVTAPRHGTAALAGADVVYTPAAGFSGVDRFRYTVTDGRGRTATAQVTVAVDPPPTTEPPPPDNRPPEAADDAADTDAGVPARVAVLANDADPDGDPLTLTAVGTPSHGTATIDGAAVVYTPAPGYAGTDAFAYTVSDGRGGTAVGRVAVTVRPPAPPPPPANLPPVPVADAVQTDYQTAVTVAPLANDADPDGDPLTLAAVDPPAHGTVELVGDTVVYTPAPGFVGQDAFAYTAADGRGGTARGAVTVTVLPSPFADLRDWTAAERGGSAGRRGAAGPGEFARTLAEGDSFVTTLTGSFVVPAGAPPLTFTLDAAGLDRSDAGRERDAVEVALLDDRNRPLTATVGAGRDALLNVTEGQPVVAAPGVTATGTAYAVDLSGVPAGTVATLVIRLVNNDADAGGRVTVADVRLPGAVSTAAPVKFFVADPAAGRAFRYGAEGLAAGTFAAAGDIRGAASTRAGDTVWLADRAARRVGVYAAVGAPLGGWDATDAVSPEGVTVWDGDLWLVDRGPDRVRRYAGGAARRAGAAAETDGFALHPDNAAPSDLVTDGGRVWVADDARREVFVYDPAGALVGRWGLDPDNAAPSGVTLDPAGGPDLWVLDRAAKAVFHYPAGRNATGGTLAAAGTFALNRANASPEGIADPPVVTPFFGDLDAFNRAAGHPPVNVDFDSIPTGTDLAHVPVNGVVVTTAAGDARPLVVRGADTFTPAGFTNASAPGAHRLLPTTGSNVLSPGGAELAPGPRPEVERDGLTFTFPAPVAAVGLDVLYQTLDDNSYTGVTVYAASGEVLFRTDSIPIRDAGGPGPAGGPAFVGFVADTPGAIAKVVFDERDDNALNPDSNIGYDTLRFRVPADPPEPSDGLTVTASAPVDSPAGQPVLITGQATPGQRPAQTLYGVTVGGELLAIDPSTGAARLLRQLPLTGVDALAVRPDGRMYVVADQNALYSFDLDTAPVFVGRVGVAASVEDLVFDGNGLLAAASLSGLQTSETLLRIDPATAAATVVGRFGPTYWDVDALTVSPGGAVYGANLASPSELFAVDPATAVGTAVGPLGVMLAGLSVSAAGTVYGSTVPSGAGGPSSLVRVSTQAGGSTIIGGIGFDSVAGLAFGPPVRSRHQVEAVWVNGRPVDALDPSGRFFAVVTPRPGVNVYRFDATDTAGRSGQLELVITGTDQDNAPPISSRLSDLSASFAPEYARTSFDEDTRTLFADVSVRNRGQYAAGAPLRVAVRNLSDPAVRVLNAAGTTPDGLPYYDLSALVAGGRLGPGQATGTATLAFANPSRGRFTYELVVLGALNRPPEIRSVPAVEATLGRDYRATVTAADPDGDPLAYRLAAGPAGMTVNETTGEVAWTPAADQLGAHEVVFRVEDGRGGAAEQRFALTATAPRPNRPPVVTSLPATTTAQVGEEFRYPVRASDADGDAVTFALAAGAPAGMDVHPATGVLTWTAAIEQRGSATFTVVVSDGNGGTATQTIDLCVNTDRNRGPVIVSEPVTTTPLAAQATGKYLLLNGDFENTAFTTLPDGRKRYEGWTERGVDGGYSGVAGEGQNGLSLGDIRDTRLDGAASPAPDPFRPFVSEAEPNLDNFGYARPSWPAPASSYAELVSDPFYIDGPVSMDVWRESVDSVSKVSFHDAATDAVLGTFTVTAAPYAWTRVTFDTTAFTGRRAYVVLHGGTSAPIYGWLTLFDNVYGGRPEPTASYTYDVEAVDPDGGPLTYSLTAAPAGVTIDPATGVINWDGRPLGPDLVTNGGFESGADPGSFSNLAAGSTGLPGWTVGPAEVNYVGTLWTAAEGRRSVDLDGNSLPGSLSQTLATTPGVRYEVTFSLAGNPIAGPAVKPVRVSAGGRHGDFTFDVTGRSYGNMGWVTRTWSFVATDAATVLTFQSLVPTGQGGAGPAIDNVSVRATTQPGQTFPVTVRVEDGRGGSDEQAFTVTVRAPADVTRGFDPVVEWQKSTFAVRPDSNQVMMTPAVIDLNADGTPDVVFSTFSGGNYFNSGVLRAVSGRDGAELWSVASPNWLVAPAAGVAVGDIDGDGGPEVVALGSAGNVLLAFESDGTPKWVSGVVPATSWGGPSLADLDRDGTPEIVYDFAVFNADGSVRWVRPGANRGSIVADLDLDGSPEVVTANAAYRADGDVYWSTPAGSGYTAVGNFDADPFPEIAIVSSGTVRLLRHDGTQIWSATLPGGGFGGAPTIADFDNDGLPEIGVAGASRYVVFETDGSVRWQSPTQDFSSNHTGSSVFDFDADGLVEVVYADETTFRIYRGTDGAVLYQLANSSATVIEYPLVADVDGDGNAEIVLVANGGRPTSGIRVIGDRNNTWVSTRRVWNQYSYHVTNVNDDGTIPRQEEPSWLRYNAYRTNVLTEGFDPRLATDLVVAGASRDGNTVTATVRNDATAPAAAGVAVGFYDGDPARGGRLLGTVSTTLRLRRGVSEAVTFTLIGPVNDLWVAADPANAVAEADETNNRLRAGVDTDPVNYAPRGWQPITTQTAVAGGVYRLTLPVIDPDGDTITFALAAGPDGFAVHPTLGVAAWRPRATELGAHAVVVTATDAAGNVTLVPFTVTVTPPNTAPVVTSAAPAGPAVVGSPFVYALRAQDAENDPLTFTLLTPFAGADLTADGRFTWTPTADQAGPREVRVRVADGRGGEVVHAFTVTVAASAPNAAPAFAGGVREAAWLGRPFATQAVATDPDGDRLRFTVVGGPDGLTVDETTGVLTWPTPVPGSHPVELRVEDDRGGSDTRRLTLRGEAQPANAAPRVVSTPPPAGNVGKPFGYDLRAADADGDPVGWRLVAGPRGVSVDPRTGALRWTPAADQAGEHTITVEAEDALTATGRQSFTVLVTCRNLPPDVVSAPVTLAYLNDLYAYPVRAADPEGDAVTFALETRPDGMTINPATGLIRWTPAAVPAGPVDVVVTASDGAATARQAFRVVVSADPPNRPPVVTSAPGRLAVVGQPYTYTVTAADPDGDGVTFGLLNRPDGMDIDRETGAITWTPAAAGPATVVVESTDGRGGRGLQTFTLTARGNRTPVLDPVADGSVSAGGTFRADLRAADPDGDAISYRVDAGPAGLSVDPFGRVAWAPADATLRTETVTVSAVDAFGAAASRTFRVAVVADTAAPAVTLSTSYTVAQVGTPVAAFVAATDAGRVVSLRLTANGVELPLDAAGGADVPTARGGFVTLVATATDAAGNVGTVAATVRVFDPAAVTRPSVTFTRLAELRPNNATRDADFSTGSAAVSYLTDVYATIAAPDAGLDYWTVFVGAAADVDVDALDEAGPGWREVARGTAEVTDGRVATFDPTLLPNDRYVLLVVAYDANGKGTRRGLYLDVTGNAKLGEFRLEFTDVNVPLAGIPVRVGRAYDTRHSAREGDFGYGWSLTGVDADIREAVAGRGDGFFTTGGAFRQGTRVFLTAPDGQRLGFTFAPVQVPALIGNRFVPAFQADPGVSARLEVDGVYDLGLTYRADGTFGAYLLGFPYNPDAYRLTTADGVTYHYTQAGGLTRAVDRNGNRVTYARDGITHSSGIGIRFVRDGAGRITEVVDASGKSIRYAYDAAGDLVRVTDQERQTTRMTYRADRPHYLDEVHDPLNRRAAKTEYGPDGRVVAVTDALGHRVAQDFDPRNFVGTQTDGRRNVTTLVYNERGNVLSRTDPEGGRTEYEYADPANPDKETRVVDPRRFVTTYAYDARGNTVRVTTPDGPTATTYNALNKVTSVVDPRGSRTEYDYDAAGNLVTVVNAVGRVSRLTYDAGRVATYTDFAGAVTAFSDYCGCGRPAKITNPDGSFRTLKYNRFGQVTRLVDELGNETVNEYDDVGRLTLVRDGEGKETTYKYKLQNQSWVRDPNGHVTEYEYDAAGRRRTITDAERNVTTFDYDENGNQTVVVDASGNRTVFTYDKANRLKTEENATDRAAGTRRVHDYDHAGNRTKTTDRNGRVRVFGYDGMNRLVTEEWKGAGNATVFTVTSAYDAAGNLLSVQDPGTRLTYTYDPLNRVRTATTEYVGSNVAPVTLTHGYDANGNRTSVVDNLGVRVDSTYDARNRLDVRSWSGGGVDPVRVEFDHRTNGERSAVRRYAGGQLAGTSVYEFFKNGLSKAITHTTPAAGTVAAYAYAYDDAGRLAGETHHGKSYTYRYDNTGQLKTVTMDGVVAESFDYDRTGNRTNAGYETGPNNRLLADGTFTYTYDAEGNTRTKTEVATGRVTEYTWDHRNRLVRVEERSAGGVVLKTVEYAYDPQGRRVAQVVDGVATLRTVYDGDHAWADYAAAGAVAARYLFGDRVDEVLARSVPGRGAAFHLADKLGTVRDLIEAGGVVLNTTDYSSFGQILSQTNPAAADRFAFTGREWDAAGGLYYYRARYYDPAAGRFLTEDPIGFASGTFGLSIYADNNPVRFMDPTGLDSIASAILLGGVSGAAGSALTSHFNGQRIDAIQVGQGFILGAIFGVVGGALAKGLATGIAVSEQFTIFGSSIAASVAIEGLAQLVGCVRGSSPCGFNALALIGAAVTGAFGPLSGYLPGGTNLGAAVLASAQTAFAIYVDKSVYWQDLPEPLRTIADGLRRYFS